VSAQEPSVEGRGRALLELASYVEASMQEARHVLPAIDHLAHLHPAPVPADEEQIAHHLEVSASPELRAAFEQWCEQRRGFADAAARLQSMRDSTDGAAFRAELDREIEAFRAVRSQLFEAADDLRGAIAHEIDAPTR
jgi:hypothetical protein